LAYADTSFLCSLYLRDANTAAATRHVMRQKPALALTAWQRCELRNAVRLSVARGNVTTLAAEQALADIDGDVAAGDLVAMDLVWPDVFAKAEELSAAHTTRLAIRTLDLVHVAAALTLGTRIFLTCDVRQFALAKAAGLQPVSV
jgi:predicted nucleic acid-binding protein